MAVSDEVILLVLAFALNHILIMNYGVNISPIRRLVGSIMTLALGGASMVVMDITNPQADINILGFGIFGICLLYVSIQLTVIFGKTASNNTD